MNARSRGRLWLRLGLLYSSKATALAGAERSARRGARTHAIVTGLRLVSRAIRICACHCARARNGGGGNSYLGFTTVNLACCGPALLH